ncbi:hypothetical protein ABZ135_31390 [Streptomyces sp. NPDC006339]|uniref:hypothetical protein n=1 Tax=Streptomyces sp. NPDC006339 TaxID=3156755 RepID=UPI00339DDD3D
MTGTYPMGLPTFRLAALNVPPFGGPADGTATIHCEAWAGTPIEPYLWLLSRDGAPTPWGAVRRLTAAAEHLADRLDEDPDDARPFPGGTLRRWVEDRCGLEDVAERLARGAYVPEAVSVIGPGHVLYTLTAMPSGTCVCREPRSLSGRTDPLAAAAPSRWSA